MKKILTYIGILFSVALFSQVHPYIDSLRLSLRTAKEDTAKVNILNALSWKLIGRGNYIEADSCALQSVRLAEKAEFKFKGRSIHLIKPTTYMNLSGKAIAYWLQDLKIPKENLLVLVDDLALPFGSLRLRTKGSSAGHNGLKNIEQLLGGQDYSRLRFGIGNDFGKGQQVDFVLSNFDKAEFEKLPEVINKANEMVLSFCTIGPERTMSVFNN